MMCLFLSSQRIMRNSALLCISEMICVGRLLEQLRPKIQCLMDDWFCVAPYELQLSLNIDSICVRAVM